MSKRRKLESTEETSFEEISFELSEEAHDALLKELDQTQWVELPFREAVIHLKQECDRFFESEHPEWFSFFAAKYVIQASDERRFNSPVVELLGILFAWETQIRDSGKELFKERVDSLLALMRTIPPEHDKTLLTLLYAIDPDAHKLMLQFTSQFASSFGKHASKKANDERHGANRARRARAMVAWDNWNERNPKGKKIAKDFAEKHCSKYGVTKEVMCRWIGEHEKEKRSLVGSTLHGE